MMVFLGYQVDRKMTINMRRECHPRITDRFDLTLECMSTAICFSPTMAIFSPHWWP
jgi:hypothetical protein